VSGIQGVEADEERRREALTEEPRGQPSSCGTEIPVRAPRRYYSVEREHGETSDKDGSLAGPALPETVIMQVCFLTANPGDVCLAAGAVSWRSEWESCFEN